MHGPGDALANGKALFRAVTGLFRSGKERNVSSQVQNFEESFYISRCPREIVTFQFQGSLVNSNLWIYCIVIY